MNDMTRRDPARTGLQRTPAGSRQKIASNFSFWLFMYFLVDFFLHLSARIPGYGVLRPTLLLVLIISMSLFAQRDKFKGWSKDPIIQAIFALLIYIALSLPLVEWPGSVIRNNLADFVKAIVFLFFTVLILDTEKRLKIFLGVFIGCQVFRVLEPLYMNLTSGYWGSATHMGHGEFSSRLAGAPSDVINPNELGFVIVTAIPFIHYLLWPQGVKSKLVYLGLAPALLYALILTQSRGAFLAFLVVGFFIFKASKHKFFLILLAIGMAIAGWSVMGADQKDRYLSLVGLGQASNTATVDGRLSGMITEFKLGLERPIVGHGLGTTPEAKTHILGGVQAAHNLYAEVFIELGIIGLVLFLRFLMRIYQRFRKNLDIFNNAEEGAYPVFYERLNQAMLTVFWMYVVYSINYWGLSQYYWYLFAGLALASSRLMTAGTPEQEKGKTPGRSVPLRRPGALRPLARPGLSR